MKISTYTRAYSLVEVLVAVTILLLAIAGPMTIASKGLQSSFYARDQLTASMLAQEGVEAVLSLRNQAFLDQLGGGSADFSAATLWDWADSNSGPLSTCFDPDGCNVSVDGSDLSNNFVSCSNPTNTNNCIMDYDPNAASGDPRYYIDKSNSSTDSPFTRKIFLTDLSPVSPPSPDQELGITVEVSWKPQIFGNGTKTVTLTTSVFNLYAQ